MTASSRELAEIFICPSRLDSFTPFPRSAAVRRYHLKINLGFNFCKQLENLIIQNLDRYCRTQPSVAGSTQPRRWLLKRWKLNTVFGIGQISSEQNLRYHWQASLEFESSMIKLLNSPWTQRGYFSTFFLISFLTLTSLTQELFKNSRWFTFTSSSGYKLNWSGFSSHVKRLH